MNSYNKIIRAILASLSPDLLEPKYRAQLAEGSPPEMGHCAVATEAFYYLAGGREAGFMPVVCGYDVDTKGRRHFDGAKPDRRRETHWWVRGPLKGERGKGRVIDITARQFSEAFPYERGHNTGFMQPQKKPSKRAQVVMDRVEEKLGRPALDAFKQENLNSIRVAAQLKKHSPTP